MFKYLVLSVLVIAGCSPEPTAPDPEPEDISDEELVEEGLVITTRITDENGNPTTEFLYGEEIFFEIEIANRADENQGMSYIRIPEPANFYLRSDSDHFGVGWTLEWWGHGPCESFSGVLGAGDSISYRVSWSENPTNMTVPPGEYGARADLTFQLDGVKPVFEWMPFTVSLPLPNDQHVFSVFHRPVMSFQLPIGQCLWAHVFRTRAIGTDRYILLGARVVDHARKESECGDVWTYPVTVPVTPLVLTHDQQQTLLRLLDEFPAVSPQVNHRCDPNYATYYRLGSATRRVGSCVNGPPEYLDHMDDLRLFIESIVPVVSQ